MNEPEALLRDSHLSRCPTRRAVRSPSVSLAGDGFFHPPSFHSFAPLQERKDAVSELSRRQQARDDRRDNQRVFVFSVTVAILVMLGALFYFYAVDKRGEGPSHEATPSAAQVQGGAQTAPAPAPAAPPPK